MLTKTLMLTSVVILAANAAVVPDWPGDRVTDEMRTQGIEMLKEAYKLNGNRMVGFGSFDLRPLVKEDRLPLPLPNETREKNK